MARELVLRARDRGWQGPQFNPIAIAELLKIPVEATADVADARTVATTQGLRIQFNPTQPRERVRFSIAHEIAHTLFQMLLTQSGTGLPQHLRTTGSWKCFATLPLQSLSCLLGAYPHSISFHQSKS
jgi:hypothetical protein